MTSLLIAICLSQAPESPKAAIIGAHVRITCRVGGSRSYGSGVVIDTGPDRTEVITNRHVVEGVTDPSQVSIADDDGERNSFRSAKVVAVSRSSTDDLARLRIAGGPAYRVARLAPVGHKVSGRVFTVGSDDGRAPRVWEARVLDTHTDPSSSRQHNFTVDHPSIPGRSGGGVYDEHGCLVGLIWGTSGSTSMCVDLTRSPFIPQDWRDALAKKFPPPLNPANPARILLFHRREVAVVPILEAYLDRLAMYDTSDARQLILAKAWDVGSTPTLIVVVPDGSGYWSRIGSLTGSEIDAERARAILELASP